MTRRAVEAMTWGSRGRPPVARAPAGRHRPFSSFLVLGLLVLLTGCGRHLVPAPNLYFGDSHQAFVNVPAEFQTNTVDVLYATDRLPKVTDEANLAYGYDRSKALQWGSTVVELGQVNRII